MISIVHPSRGRPEQSFNTLRRWIMKAGVQNLEIIVSVDLDDVSLPHYQTLYRGYNLIVGQNKSSVDAINAAARLTKGDIIMVVSDDQEPSPQWAIRIMKYTEGRKDWVMKTFDGLQPKIITLPIMDRIYYQRDGYVYYPEYKHLFADREFTDVATIRKRVITKNIRFPHRHHSILKRKPDECYQRSGATYEQGKKLYQLRKQINFGL